MDYQLVRFRLDHVCDLILGGLLALPDFQRDFVWSPNKVVDLLQSIAREWPIGSLLILEGPVVFASKAIDCGPHVSEKGIKYYLLDGQQRITSMFHSIKDLSDFVYYIDFNKISADGPEEDFIFFQRRKSFERLYPGTKELAENGLAKISDIYETERFIEWLSFVDHSESRREYTQFRRNYLYGLNAGVYSVPATVLPHDVNFTALSKIFEGLNTSSVRLTTADLLVAANLPKGVNLRDLWSEYIQKDRTAELLNLDMLDVLKTCALIERRSDQSKVRGLKQADLIKIDPIIYKRNWYAACAQLNDAADYAFKNLGVINKNMLPSPSNLIALSFLVAERSSKAQIFRLWIEWIFSETFSQSAHTRLLTVLSNSHTQEWGKPFILEQVLKFSTELDFALQKPCGSNSYLLRGISSIRAALALNHLNSSDLQEVSNNRDKAIPFNIKTGSFHKKNDLIQDVFIGEKAASSIKVLGDECLQSISSANFDKIVNELTETKP